MTEKAELAEAEAAKVELFAVDDSGTSNVATVTEVTYATGVYKVVLQPANGTAWSLSCLDGDMARKFGDCIGKRVRIKYSLEVVS